MSMNAKIPPLHGPVITGINLVDRITRPRQARFEASSLPGHLIHLVTRGRVEQESSGMRQRLEPGLAVWYFEDELVSGRVLEAPWVFYTVNFAAPALQPPPFDRRVVRYGPETLSRMEHLYRVWQDLDAPAAARQLRLHAQLMEIVLVLLPDEARDLRMDDAAGVWWRIEAALRADLSRPVDLRSIAAVAGLSIRTVVRACHLSTGTSPMKRVKQLRLSYARGLVMFSELSMTEIAFRVAYSRVQEFSRDYRKAYGVMPTADRRCGPGYADEP
jgi:AraC-like DNA-binding protein